MQVADGLIVDNFAGGGGASTGLFQALGRHPDVAINHDDAALTMHEANHPTTTHMRENVWDVVPAMVTDLQGVEWAWFSPDCTHFSKAKGGRPVSSRIRGLAWVAVKWAKQVRPRRIFVENVGEFQDWGPLSKETGKPIKARKGELFRRWVNSLRKLGYAVEWRVLDAADYGVPTHRKRLFVIARCDGVPIKWPEPTHGPGLKPYVPASSIIDWSIPGNSIFGRKRPLVENTMSRISKGLRRYVLEAGDDAFIVRTGHYSNITGAGATLRGQRLHKPLGCVTAGVNDKALVIPWITQAYGGPNGRMSNKAGGKPITMPLPAVTGTDHNWLAAAQVEAVSKRLNEKKVDDVRAFFIKYYGTAVGSSVRSPLHTLTHKARMGLVEVHGRDYQIVDITLRMLKPHELAAAQGFPPDYVLTGNQTSQIAKIGNSVCPPMARELALANAA